MPHQIKAKETQSEETIKAAAGRSLFFLFSALFLSV
jgi:hypothetical protein